MKKPYLKELQGQLLGTVTDNADVRAFFATDASIFTIKPEAVVYPRNTADVRKTVQLLNTRAIAGKPVGIIPRGLGTDQSGGAIGAGLQLVFPAHMNRLLRLSKDTVTVQPGINYRTLQQTLHTHGRFLPPYPTSIDFCTVGGAVANNSGGEKSIKYGVTRNFVKSLKVVLSDGSLIETKRISKRELGQKLGQNDFEGQIYRKVDRLIEEHEALIAKTQPKTSKNAAGYALANVKRSDGSLNLSELIVGSQGTLGIVTEITLKTAPWNPRTTLVVGYLSNLKVMSDVIEKLSNLKPSSLEIVDGYMLENIRRNRPQDLVGLLPEETPKIVLLAEFDDFSQLSQTFKARRAEKLLALNGVRVRVATDPVEQEALWKIRHSAAGVTWMSDGPKTALPFIEDGIVPVGKLAQFLDKTYQLLAMHDMEIAVWGHAGDGNLHLQPYLDLSKKTDVDKLFKIAGEFHDIVKGLGGSTSGSHNDGLMRAPYLRTLYGDKMYELFEQVKAVFDPLNIMNPGKKLGVTEEIQRDNLRTEYSLKRLYDHLPRT